MATTEERLKQYEDLYNQAQTYDPNQFKTDFEKAYGEATGYNKDLITQQASSLGELQTVAPTLREKYMNTLITDPTRQMSLIAQARQAPLTSYSQATSLLGARGNKYQDILGKQLGIETQRATQANTAAENAWRLYQDAVSQDQFNRSQKASSGGSNLASILQALGMGGTGTTTVTETPQQKVMKAVDSIKQMRQTTNMSSDQFNAYYNEIMKQAQGLGVKLNPEGLWVALGNAPAKPMSYNLFM